MDDSTFSVGKKAKKSSADSELRLEDGSIFAVGGVHSSLALLAKKDKISDESKVFSIGIREEEARQKKEEKEKYSITSEIARGGMGSILQAQDNDLRRAIAMKVMLAGEKPPPPEYERFIKEAQVTGFLEHPNIIPVHELGVDKNSRPFFTMKLVSGESLQSILQKINEGQKSYKEKYPLNRLLGKFIQICNAISFAHSRGVVHRDLKPENIMIGDFGEVLVMDWGLSKIKAINEIQVQRDFPLDNDYTKTIEGSVLGTPAYMPPEQAKGDIDSTDERSDIFSLGAILYEIITGRPPYEGTSIMEVLAKAAKAKIKHPSKIKKVPEELARICLKAMNPNKENRYQTVQDLTNDIGSYLDHRVIPEYKLKPWQKILQSLGIGAIFFLLIFPINFTSLQIVSRFLSVPCFIVVVGVGLCYQIMVYGIKLSIFGRLFRRNRSTAQTAGSLKLQEGCLFGGILGTLIGIFIILDVFRMQYSELGMGMSTALITVLYIYPFFLLLRLDYTREARHNALFGIIASNRVSTFLQMIFLFIVPHLTLLIMYILSKEARVDFANVINNISIRYLVSYALYIFIISLVLCIIYFRIIFTFQELMAAVGHLFTFLSGGEVSEENKIHASSVLRFFSETFYLWVVSSCLIAIIGLLARIQNTEDALNGLLMALFTSILALLLYIVTNYFVLKRFAGDGGYKKSLNSLNQSVLQFYKYHYGSFWTTKKTGKFVAILSTLGFITIVFLCLLISGALILSIFSFLSYLLASLVIVFASYQRTKYRKLFIK